MKIERTRNAQRNFLYGVILKVYQLVIPFFMRTIMIYQMGIEYAGLNNLFTSIFQVLNLAELGIGAALTYSMYRPIASDDEEQICALLKLYKTCFTVIGAVVLGMGLLCMPLLPHLVSGAIPDNLNLQILYLMYLTNTVLSYWLFSYKKSLLYAHQRNDINSKVLILSQTIQYGAQVVILLGLKNYYLYLMAAIIGQIVNNIVSAFIVNKIYPRYRPNGQLAKEDIYDIKKRVQGLVTNKVGGVILRSADSVVISSFLGLTVLAVYQNYYFILTAVIGVLSIMFEGCIAGIGNSLLIESDEKNYVDFKTMTFITCWVSAVCCSCFLVLYQPFITAWVGRQYLMEFPLVVCMVIYFFVYEIDSLVGTFKDAAGMWYKDRYRPLVTALVNLGLNIIMIQFLGLYGVLLSTVISLVVVGIPWLLHNVFDSIFKTSSLGSYVGYLIQLGALTVFSSALSVWCSNQIGGESILSFVIKAVVAVIIPNIIVVISFAKTPEFKRTVGIVTKFVKNKKKDISL